MYEVWDESLNGLAMETKFSILHSAVLWVSHE